MDSINENHNQKVVRDMSEDYQTKLSSILDEIDSAKQLLQLSAISPNGRTPLSILINERLHSLYIKLYAKANKAERFLQDSINNKIHSYNNKAFMLKKKMLHDGSISKIITINASYYTGVLKLIEKREKHIYEIMERVGLTAKMEKERRRLT